MLIKLAIWDAYMASLYAKYLLERTNDCIWETEAGFATYRYLPERNAVYIIDIFVLPSSRKTGHAALIADQIALVAKSRGCTEMLGSVQPSAKGSDASIRVLQAYGMTLLSAGPDAILFRKDI